MVDTHEIHVDFHLSVRKHTVAELRRCIKPRPVDGVIALLKSKGVQEKQRGADF
jgi:hypothetical protein